MVMEPNEFDFLDTTLDKMAENVWKVHWQKIRIFL